MPKPDVTFSGVMSADNAARTIQAPIASVLAQTRHDFELIVVDDEATDERLEIARRFTDPQIRILTLKQSGPAATRNAGISISPREVR
jgi:teichuronic acid biosynthesis glycosyltransferase TuaG